MHITIFLFSFNGPRIIVTRKRSAFLNYHTGKNQKKILKSKIQEPKSTSDRSINVTGTKIMGTDSGRVKTFGYQGTLVIERDK